MCNNTSFYWNSLRFTTYSGVCTHIRSAGVESVSIECGLHVFLTHSRRYGGNIFLGRSGVDCSNAVVVRELRVGNAAYVSHVLGYEATWT